MQVMVKEHGVITDDGGTLICLHESPSATDDDIVGVMVVMMAMVYLEKVSSSIADIALVTVIKERPSVGNLAC